MTKSMRFDPSDDSDYTYRIENNKDGSVLVIIDLNIGRKSVTNNIEAILRRIAADEKIVLTTMQIIYRDSEGNYDRVQVSASGSVSFYPLFIDTSVTDEQQAIKLALEAL